VGGVMLVGVYSISFDRVEGGVIFNNFCSADGDNLLFFILEVGRFKGNFIFAAKRVVGDRV
jgi:hypothetical protein